MWQHDQWKATPSRTTADDTRMAIRGVEADIADTAMDLAVVAPGAAVVFCAIDTCSRTKKRASTMQRRCR